jgi:hypothetical protein
MSGGTRWPSFTGFCTPPKRYASRRAMNQGTSCRCRAPCLGGCSQEGLRVAHVGEGRAGRKPQEKNAGSRVRASGHYREIYKCCAVLGKLGFVVLYTTNRGFPFGPPTQTKSSGLAVPSLPRASLISIFSKSLRRGCNVPVAAPAFFVYKHIATTHIGCVRGAGAQGFRSPCDWFHSSSRYSPREEQALSSGRTACRRGRLGHPRRHCPHRAAAGGGRGKTSTGPRR